MTEEETSLLKNLDELEQRQLDVLIARYIYELEVFYEASEATREDKNIKYLYKPKKKVRPFKSHYRKIYYEQFSKRPLPRYTFDDRDAYKLMRKLIKQIGTIDMKVTDKESIVTIEGIKIKAPKLPRALSQAILFFFLKKQL